MSHQPSTLIKKKQETTTTRSNIKQSSLYNVRQSMNQRRQDLSSKIRKSKRRHHVQLKRRLVVAAQHVDADMNGCQTENVSKLSMEKIIHQFLMSPNEMSLNALQHVLASRGANVDDDSNENITNLLLYHHPDKGLELISKFHTILISANNHEMKLQVLRILTNLAAINQSTNEINFTNNDDGEDDANYYGPSQPSNSQSWCELIIYNLLNSALIPCLRNRNYDNNVQLQMIAQTCWVIGNLGGEESTREFIIQNSDTIYELIKVLQWTMLSCNQPRTTMTDRQHYFLSVSMGIIRNTLWALSNLARGSHTSALIFFHQTKTGSTLISPSDMISIAQSEDSNVTNNNDSSIGEIVTWTEIHVEMYWLLAFLTAREDEVMDILFSSSLSSHGLVLLDTILLHFYNVTETIISSCKNGRIEFNKNKEKDDGSAVRMIIPILRIIGNMACASSGKFIPHILSRRHPKYENETIVSILSKWMYVIDYHPSHEIMSISTEATWVCGALLCDAGYDDHPSTTVACPTLIPALCHVMIGHDSGGNKIFTTLELKREVLSALWNAVSVPPCSYVDGVVQKDTIKIRDLLLKSICDKVEILSSIVDMSQCLDSDAKYLSLCIINVVHRRLLNQIYDANGMIRRALDETDCLNILEGVCDSASASYQYGGGKDWNVNRDVETCAEIAANLIDDFYDEEWNDGQQEMSVNTSNGFVFDVNNLNF